MAERDSKGRFIKGCKSWNIGLNISGMSGKKQSELFMTKLKERNKNNNSSKRPEIRKKMSEIKLGKPRAGNPDNWKHTKETKLKISKSHSGKILSEDHKKNVSLALGGTGIPYEINLYPEEFFKIRYEIMKRDNFTCQICNQYGNKSKNYLSVHHIDYNKNNNQEINLITLCKKDNIKSNFNRKNWIKIFQEKIINILTKNRRIL